jgi:hypothetical protein
MKVNIPELVVTAVLAYIGAVIIAIYGIEGSLGDLKALARVQGCEYMVEVDKIVFMKCSGSVKTFLNPY